MVAPSVTAIHRPIFKEKYFVTGVPGEGFFLVGENDVHVLEGANLTRVVPLVDGRRTTDDIARALAPHVPPQDVHATIAFLAERGHVREADPATPAQFAAFWTELGVDTRALPALFARSPVRIVSLSERPHPDLHTTASALGLQLSPTGSVWLVATDDYLDPRLEAINRMALQDGTPWLLFKPDGVNIWVGPYFVPGRTACWSCLAARLRDNREVESYLRARTQLAEPLRTTRARLWTSAQQAYSMAVTQLVRSIATGQNPVLESNVVICETVAFAFTYHPVTRRPQCASCGDPQLTRGAPAPVRFTDHRKTHASDGGERHEPPEITFEKYRHHISSITGVVRGIHPSPWHHTSPLRTYVAGHNFALKNGSLYFLKDGVRTHSSGKGRTDAQARTSALCEALERYSGVYRGEEPTLRATFRELGEDALHPNACMLFSEEQYRRRDEWLRRDSRFQIVPRPLDETARIDWSPVFSHTEQRVKYLPTSYLYYGYPYDDATFYCWADSNGNASGTSREDACLQAFYELVERDAVCIWWYNQIPRPAVDLDSFGDPYISELREFYAAMGREFWVLDLTNDLQIPVFAAITRRLQGPTEDILFGFGAHMDPRIAASRAMTEMNQFLPAVLNIAPSGHTRYGIDDRDALAWWQTATVLNQPYLAPLTSNFNRSLRDYASPAGGSILDRLMACFALVEKLGLEVLLLDQTRPDIGMNVVKVMVPGLRHFWARFAPGRLFDVPVTQGWISAPVEEAHLNPVPMFL